MPAAAGINAGSLGARVVRRLQAMDPLLPVPDTQPPGCGAELVVAGTGGQPAATGTCEHWVGQPGSLDLTWGAARRFQLTVRLAGPDVAPALDQLLSLWRDHLAELPGADGADTAALVTRPSRDIGGASTLLRRDSRRYPLSRRARHPAIPAGPRTVPPGPRTVLPGKRTCGSGGPGPRTSTRLSAWDWR
jgi:hypothetical protein